MDSSSPVALPSAVTTEIRAATFLKTTWQNLELSALPKGLSFRTWLLAFPQVATKIAKVLTDQDSDSFPLKSTRKHFL